MERICYEEFKTVVAATELSLNIYKPLQRGASLMVCEAAEFRDGGTIVDGKKKVHDAHMSTLVTMGLQDLQKEMAAADYLTDLLGGKTPVQAVEWLMAFYSEEKNGKLISTMRPMHAERGLRLPIKDTDQLDATRNFVEIFEPAFEQTQVELGGMDFSPDDCDRLELDIQRYLRRDNSSGNVSLRDVTRLFRRSGLERWKFLFNMTPEDAAKEIFNAQKIKRSSKQGDKRNHERREQIPYIITDLMEAIIDHPYRHAMKKVVHHLSSSGYLDWDGSARFNLLFYHYPQRFLDGIIPALHPMGRMLIHAPSFIDIAQKLYGRQPSDADADGRDFILACHTAAKVYTTISELDNNEIKMRQYNKREKARDPKLLEETLGD